MTEENAYENVLKAIFAATMADAHINLKKTQLSNGSYKTDKAIHDEVVKIYESYFNEFDF